jgi:HPt (histidine-containing phosphotransfer) domain-containing protein
MKDATTPAPPLPARQRSQFADDPDMRSIIRAFIDEMPARVRDLRDCWERHDLERLMRLTHQIRGAAGGYGFPAIAEAALQLQASLRTIVGPGAPVPPARLQDEFARLIDQCLSADAD